MRNGSGTFNLLTNSWNPATNGTPATAEDYQALINDIAAAITQSVSKDGQTALTGNLPAGGNKLTGLAAGTTAGDSLRYEQLKVLQKVLANDAGVTVGATSLTSAMASGNVSITPLSTTSKLLISVSFDGRSAYAAATNISTTLRLFEGTVATPIGSTGSMFPTSATGGDTIFVPGTIRAIVTNTSLTARTFGLGAFYTGAASLGINVSNMVWEITEVQN